MRLRVPFPSSMGLAIGGAALAASLAVAALVRAIGVREPSPIITPTLTLPDEVTSSGGEAPLPSLDDDPFSPDRTAPTKPYSLAAAMAPTRGRSAKTAAPTVLGTVVASDGSSFAIGAIGDGPTKTVAVGGKIGEYTVKAVGRGHVVFTGPAGEELSVRATAGVTERPHTDSLGGQPAPSDPNGSTNGLQDPLSNWGGLITQVPDEDTDEPE